MKKKKVMKKLMWKSRKIKKVKKKKTKRVIRNGDGNDTS